jgi:AGZA family xanthine/uracil permease-like MFS transporter
MAYYPVTGKIVLFGGSNGSRLGDTFAFVPRSLLRRTRICPAVFDNSCASFVSGLLYVPPFWPLTVGMIQTKPEHPNIRTEALAGITTFFTMSYIVVVNPSILSTEGTGMPFSGVLTATVLVCFTMTLLMGIYAKLPFAVAPGMGLNAFFAFTIILGQRVPWPTALGIIFWAGVLFLLISVTPVRTTIAKAIPPGLRIAAAVGIGIFLTFIGLRNAGFIAADPVTFVRLGPLDHRALLTIVGLTITIWLVKRKSPLAYLVGIISVTVLALLLGRVQAPPRIFSAPDFKSVFLKLDILGALKLSLLPAIISILFTDLFDSISTFIGVAHATNLLDENGHPRNLKEGLIVDALATLGAGLAGTSSGTAYIESVAGIEAGGRTGLTAVFTALCFLPCFFIAPLAGSVPAYATAPVLILVGAAMFKSITKLSFDKIEDSLPAFLTIVLIPLTFSITQGILWGFISHVGLYLMSGRRSEIHPVMFILALVSIGLLALEHLHP